MIVAGSDVLQHQQLTALLRMPTFLLALQCRLVEKAMVQWQWNYCYYVSFLVPEDRWCCRYPQPVE
jgi:hypothetical protein